MDKLEGCRRFFQMINEKLRYCCLGYAYLFAEKLCFSERLRIEFCDCAAVKRAAA